MPMTVSNSTRNERERLTWLDMAQSWPQVGASEFLRRWNLSLISLVATRRSLICPRWEFRSLRFGGTAELKSPNRMRRMMQFQIRTNGSHFR